MKSILMVSGALAPLLILAACGGTTDADSDGDGKISSEEAAAVAADVKITPGEWENTVEFVEVKIDETKLPAEARGMIGPMLQSMVGQKTTVKNCITPEEAAKPDAAFLSGNDDGECEYEKFNFGRGKMDIAMTCKGGGADGGDAKVTMAGDYSPTAYTMDMNITTNAPQAGEMTIKAKSSARRIGECPG